jgi:hypothetical protein
LDGGNEQYSGWKRTYQGVVEDDYWQVIGFFVVFEASFAEVQGGESAHAEGAFFAVIAWTQTAEKLEDTVNCDEGNQQEHYTSCKIVQ